MFCCICHFVIKAFRLLLKIKANRPLLPLLVQRGIGFITVEATFTERR